MATNPEKPTASHAIRIAVHNHTKARCLDASAKRNRPLQNPPKAVAMRTSALTRALSGASLHAALARDKDSNTREMMISGTVALRELFLLNSNIAVNVTVQSRPNNTGVLSPPMI